LAAIPRASIIIVTAGDGALLHSCLQRLGEVAPAVEHETIVVTNGAPEADAARLRRSAPHVRVCASPVNLGFAGALNAGRALATGEFVVSLHDDAEVRPGWLEALVAAADRDPEAGAVGSLVLGTDGGVQAAGWRLLPDGSTRPPWDAQPPDPSAFDRPLAVDYAPSCSLLVRASSWDEVGGADERFFPLYYVDVDLCLAIRVRGQRVVCEPASVVVHRRGASTNRDFALFLTDRNRELLLEKWGEAVAGPRPGSRAPLEVPAQQRARSEAERGRLATIRAAETSRAFAESRR
jgi:GT2 family glycosyltransferase